MVVEEVVLTQLILIFQHPVRVMPMDSEFLVVAKPACSNPPRALTSSNTSPALRPAARTPMRLATGRRLVVGW